MNKAGISRFQFADHDPLRCRLRHTQFVRPYNQSTENREPGTKTGFISLVFKNSRLLTLVLQKMEIRRLTAQDAEFLPATSPGSFATRAPGFHRLGSRTPGHDFGGNQDSTVLRRRQFRHGSLHRSPTRRHGRILSPKGEKIRHRGGIWGVYVSEECRGKGVGRALLAELIQPIKLLPGMEQVALAVSRQNAGAKVLYESLGFEVYGCEKRALKVGDEYV